MAKCLECPMTFQPAKTGRQPFCSNRCKAAFHNRRAKRGAALYDAMMLRFEDPAKYAGFLERVELLLATWAAEDKAAGRARTTKTAFDVGFDLPRTDVVISRV